jgi:hypothetical protein
MRRSEGLAASNASMALWIGYGDHETDVRLQTILSDFSAALSGPDSAFHRECLVLPCRSAASACLNVAFGSGFLFSSLLLAQGS